MVCFLIKLLCYCYFIIILIHKVSDIHISKYREPQRGKDLKQFCDENIDVIRPIAVLATGKEIQCNNVVFLLTPVRNAQRCCSAAEWLQEALQNSCKEAGCSSRKFWLFGAAL